MTYDKQKSEADAKFLLVKLSDAEDKFLFTDLHSSDEQDDNILRAFDNLRQVIIDHVQGLKEK